MYVFVKLTKVSWPGELVDNSKFTMEMREAYEDKMKRAKKNTFLKIVKFFDEDGFHLVTKETDLIEYECEKKEEIIKRGAAHLHNNQKSHSKFKQDIIKIETLLGKRSEQLSQVWFDKLTAPVAKGISVVKEVFREPEVVKPGQVVVKKKKVGEEFKGEKKRFSCECGFSVERVNAFLCHKKTCGSTIKTKASPKKATPKKLSPKPSPVKKDTPTASKTSRQPKSRKTKNTENVVMKTNILLDWEEEVDDDEDDDKPPELRIFESIKEERKPDVDVVVRTQDEVFERLMASTRAPEVESVGVVPQVGNKEKAVVDEEMETECDDGAGAVEGDADPVAKTEMDPIKEDEPMSIDEIDEPPPVLVAEPVAPVLVAEPVAVVPDPIAPTPVAEPLAESIVMPTTPTIPQKPTATIKPNPQQLPEQIPEKPGPSSGSGDVGVAEEIPEVLDYMHLVPVENADGSISYMLLTLNSNDLNNIKIDATPITGIPETTPPPTTVEALFLDKPTDLSSVISSFSIAKEPGTSQVEGCSQGQPLYLYSPEK